MQACKADLNNNILTVNQAFQISSGNRVLFTFLKTSFIEDLRITQITNFATHDNKKCGHKKKKKKIRNTVAITKSILKGLGS